MHIRGTHLAHTPKNQQFQKGEFGMTFRKAQLMVALEQNPLGDSNCARIADVDLTSAIHHPGGPAYGPPTEPTLHGSLSARAW